ncbi:LacI family DNA-binding transcriptional regulator [Microlunatus spumicola]|uniref:LacI family DNA-binding transcriptional regulator n=1 Tax=Microlunatus spumicola TaxID=81499 RepID=A0ABP6XG10_9ACTN
MTKPGRATLETVAVAAGVSMATVSKVLNDRHDVGPGTRLRVQRLLEEYDYAPPRRSPGRTTPVRLPVELIFGALDSPYSVEILRGVTSGPLDVVVSSRPTASELVAWSAGLTSQERCGAILVTSELTPAVQDNLARARLPYVLIDPAGELPDPSVATVGATNWAGGVSATRHLLELGHRRIAVIGGPEAMLCSRARIAGYSSELASWGVALDPALVRHGSFHHRAGYDAALALLDLPDPPTAIFAGSDEQAFGVIEATRVTGRRIPEDLSVVGFDDLPVARWFSPPLTTVRQPLADMGRTAAGILAEMLTENEPFGRQVELATKLVVRASTAPLDGSPLVHGGAARAHG